MNKVIQKIINIGVKFNILKPSSSMYFNLKYITMNKNRPFPFKEVLDFTQSLIPISTLDGWLDVGCGFGEFPNLIKERFPHLSVMGIDFSIAAVRKAQKNYPECNFRLNSVYKIDFSNNHFDIVSIVETLEHLKNPNQALSEIFRILKPLGYLIISVPYKGIISHEHIHTFDKETLCTLMPSRAQIVDFGFISSKFDEILLAIFQKNEK